MARQLDWNWSLLPGHSSFNDPDYDRGNPYFPAPPITAFGNIQIPGAIALLREWWAGVHPEVEIVGVQDKNKYKPDKGFIIYSMLDQVASDRTPKPKLHNEVLDGASGEVYIVSTMSFISIIQFMVVHREPEVADQIIEDFKAFMLFEATPFLKRAGIEDVRFGNRMRDSTLERSGEDLSARSITFRIGTQEILYSTLSRLTGINIKLMTHMGSDSDATPSIPGIIEIVRNGTDSDVI